MQFIDSCNFVSENVIYLLTIAVSLQVGLLYDDESLRCITDMIADWISEERDMLRRKVSYRTIF